MKKLLCLALALMMALTLFGCRAETAATEPPPKKPPRKPPLKKRRKPLRKARRKHRGAL